MFRLTPQGQASCVKPAAFTSLFGSLQCGIRVITLTGMNFSDCVASQLVFPWLHAFAGEMSWWSMLDHSNMEGCSSCSWSWWMLVATGARWAAAIVRVGYGPFWRPTDTTPGGGNGMAEAELGGCLCLNWGAGFQNLRRRNGTSCHQCRIQ